MHTKKILMNERAITIALAFLRRSELKAIQIDFYVSLLSPSISGQGMSFFMMKCHHQISNCHVEPGYRQLLIHSQMWLLKHERTHFPHRV